MIANDRRNTTKLRGAEATRRPDDVIVSVREFWHITTMFSVKSKRSKSGQAKRGLVTYRGIRIQMTSGRSRFDEGELQKVVEAAVKKNANALSGRTKS